MTDLFTSLPVEITQQIQRHLDQRDCVSLVLSSKTLGFFYPKHISKVFALDATYQEYLDFTRAISNPHVDSFDACVHPAMWNKAFDASEKRFLEVCICPNDVKLMTWPCRFPEAVSTRSGFLHSKDSYCVSFQPQCVRICTSSTVQFPYIHPSILSAVTTIEVGGQFTHLADMTITGLQRVFFKQRHFTVAELDFLSSAGLSLRLSNCTFDNGCSLHVNRCDAEIDVEYLRYVRVDADDIYTHLVVYLHGGAIPTTVYEVRSYIEVTVIGFTTSAPEDVVEYMSRCFPLSLCIHYNDIRFVDPV